MAHQESELANLLKKIPLGNAELCVIRDRAEQLRDGKLKSRGEALLPLTLASFIFDSLCLPGLFYNKLRVVDDSKFVSYKIRSYWNCYLTYLKFRDVVTDHA